MAYEDLTGAWDHATLAPQVVFGRECHVEGAHVFGRCRGTRQPSVTIGNRVRIYTWTVFNVEPEGFVEVGDESVLVGAVIMCAERVAIGRRVVISYNVTIADSDFHPHDPVERRKDAVATAPFGDRSRRPALISRPVVIMDGAWIGIGAIILKGVTIGSGARIGAGSVVTSDVPDGAVVAGNPSRLLSGEVPTP
jgi:acetyltransferase-like isoleucine patch superfamily enzyme